MSGRKEGRAREKEGKLKGGGAFSITSWKKGTVRTKKKCKNQKEKKRKEEGEEKKITNTPPNHTKKTKVKKKENSPPITPTIPLTKVLEEKKKRGRGTDPSGNLLFPPSAIISGFREKGKGWKKKGEKNKEKRPCSIFPPLEVRERKERGTEGRGGKRKKGGKKRIFR